MGGGVYITLCMQIILMILSHSLPVFVYDSLRLARNPNLNRNPIDTDHSMTMHMEVEIGRWIHFSLYT
jgi:hypothetical protein